VSEYFYLTPEDPSKIQWAGNYSWHADQGCNARLCREMQRGNDNFNGLAHGLPAFLIHMMAYKLFSLVISSVNIL
jgi:hypothetical protein